MNKRYYNALQSIAIIFALFISVLSVAPKARAELGEEIFQSKCSACHSIGGGRRVGPDLAGVMERRTKDWLQSFITSPKAMIDGGDATAKTLFDEFGIMMPDNPLSSEELTAVIAYVETSSGGSSGAGATEATATEFTVEDKALGEQLFQGKVRFEKGGAACISCHNVNNDAVISGGKLAKDLTSVFSRVGEAGVSAVIGSPPFPVMQQAYNGKDLTTAEVTALTAFLAEVDQHSSLYQPRDYGIGLFGSGVVGVAFLFGFYAFFWNGRKRETVYKEMFDRQVESRWEP